jgi:hypothetical protein
MAAPQFVLVRTFAGWPIMAAWIFVLVFYIRLRLDPLNFHLAQRERGHRPTPAP